jgi:DNA-binding beta-propeller fold protein YncE
MNAQFNTPQDVAISPQGAVIVADNGNHRFRQILNGTVSTVAGNGVAGFAEGSPLMASFFGMEGFSMSPDGFTLYVADGSGGEDDQLFNRVRIVRLR